MVVTPTRTAVALNLGEFMRSNIFLYLPFLKKSDQPPETWMLVIFRSNPDNPKRNYVWMTASNKAMDGPRTHSRPFGASGSGAAQHQADASTFRHIGCCWVPISVLPTPTAAHLISPPISAIMAAMAQGLTCADCRMAQRAASSRFAQR